MAKASKSEIQVDWVSEIPKQERAKRPNPYDPIIEQVRATGKIAKIASTKKAASNRAQLLRQRHPDISTAVRTYGDEAFIFVSRKEGDNASA